VARDLYPDASPFHVVRDPNDPSRSSYTRSDRFAEPTFCTGSTEDEINRAHEALKNPNPELDPVFTWDPGRHKDAKDPYSCEVARLYDLATDRWFRESPGSLLKDLGAGIVNGIIPGSDLGDAGSSTQFLGQVIGGISTLGFNPTSLATSALTSATKAISNVSFLNTALSFATKVATGPFGSIATQAIGSLLSKTPTPQVVLQSPYQGTNNIQESLVPAYYSSTSGSKPVSLVTDAKANEPLPAWVTPVAWGLGALALLGILWKLFTKKSRR